MAGVAKLFHYLITFTTAVLPWERPEESSCAEKCFLLLLNLCQKEREGGSLRGNDRKDVRENLIQFSY